MSSTDRRLPSGIIPILATAFDALGRIDEHSFARQVDACIDDGAAAVAMFGLASEYYKLTDAERDRLAHLTVTAARGRVPVILSVTPHARELALEEARRFGLAGASALMILPPFFLAPSEQAIVAHIGAIADAVDLPVIVQYAPLQTGRAIDPNVFLTLAARHPNVEGVKVDMIPTGPYLGALEGLCTYVGYAGLHLPEAVARGASGCMPSSSMTRAFARCWGELIRDHERGRETHRAMLPALNFMMQSIEFVIACEKRVLVERGVFETDYCRAPRAVLDDVQIRELDRCAEALR